MSVSVQSQRRSRRGEVLQSAGRTNGDTSYTEAEAKAGINLVLGSTVTSPTGTPPLPAPLPTSNPAPTTQPPPIPPHRLAQQLPPTQQPRPPGDLGLPTPISNPPCNGQVIVILGNITTPGLYAAGVQQLLDAHPGAYYLRTDQSCPSLRRANEAGNPIYAVFEPTTPGEVCKAVRLAGGGAYGKWLGITHTTRGTSSTALEVRDLVALQCSHFFGEVCVEPHSTRCAPSQIWEIRLPVPSQTAPAMRRACLPPPPSKLVAIALTGPRLVTRRCPGRAGWSLLTAFVGGHVIPQGWPSRNSPGSGAAVVRVAKLAVGCQVVVVPGRFRGR